MTQPKTGKRVTLQDIAQATGYTINTVSRALKDKSDISRATCEKIQRVAQEMGYVCNYMASSLRLGRTRTLGLIVGGMSNPYYAVMSDLIQDVAMALDYSLMIMYSRDDAKTEMQVVDIAIGRQVDGILLFPCLGSAPTIERMRAANMPFVLMSRYLQRDAVDSVICDEEQGAYLATRHLIEAGRRRLAFLSSYEVLYSGPARLHGFMRACDEAGIAPGDRHTAICRTDEEIAGKLLAWRQCGVNGLFMFCDMEAWNAISLMIQNGIRMPQDVAITSFDNIQGKLSFPLPLCSVDGAMPDVTRSAVDLLLKRVHGDKTPPQTIVYPAKLVCRGSCGCNARNS